MTWDSLLQRDDSIGAWLSGTKGIFPVILFVLSSHFNEQTLLLSLQNKKKYILQKYLLLWFYLFLAMLGLLHAACRLSLVAACSLLIAVASLIVEHRLRSCGAWV